MKRFAVAAVVVVSFGMKADAQIYDGGPLYHSPYYAPNAIGRYYPAWGSGFYMQQPSGFGIVDPVTGTIPPTVYPSGIVLANPISPGYLYNDALYNSLNSFTPGYGSAGYFVPGYASSHPGLIRRFR